MAKIKIEGNASGTGTLTISAPATNTDRSLTLPDGAGEILTDASTLSSSNLSGALPAIDGSALTGISGGVADASVWRLSSDYHYPSQSTTVYLTSWEEQDTGGYGRLGTGMTHSSGVFTFPSTGIWLIQVVGEFSAYDSGANNDYACININYTSNNSSYSQQASTCSSPGAYTYETCITSLLVDVTDTSNQKIKFSVYVEDYLDVVGGTSENRTHVVFMKLGDT
jgi:hypothetical protein